MKFDVSVVVPTFNSEKYVAQTIESILVQKNVSTEIIVIDGKSTDGTLDVLNHYREEIAILVSEKDRGVVDALNKGLCAATSNLLCWLNSDDVYVNDKALLSAKMAIEMGGVDFAYGHSLAIDELGFVTKTSYAWRTDPEEYKRWSNIFTGSLFFSRRAWIEFGGFDEKYSVVFEYQLIDFLLSRYKFLLLDSHVAALRQYAGTLSDRLQKEIPGQVVDLRGEIHEILLEDRLRRLFRLISQGIFLPAFSNVFFDKYAGRNWRDIASNIADAEVRFL